MSLEKHSKRPRIWLSSFIIWIFVCGFAVWGIRELLFPATNVCAIERAEGKNLLDISQVYPITNNIELVGHVGGMAESVFVRGDIAFVKLGLELAAFNIQNPSSPKRIGYILISGDLIHVDSNGNFAYIHSSDDQLGLWKVDVSKPAQMSAVHIYKPIDYNYIKSIRLLDEQAYITTRKCKYIIFFFEGSIPRCDNTIHIVDTSNLSAPNKCYQGLWGKVITAFITSGAQELINPPKTVRQGSYSYVAEEKDGFKVYDVSNPIRPIEVSSYSPYYKFTDVDTYGSYVFATSVEHQDQKTKYALHLFDANIPTDPKDLGELPYKPIIITEFSHYAVVRGEFGSGGWPSGVEILDMSLPNSNKPIVAPPQMAGIVNMVVIDNRAYASTSDNMFLILDMSNIENPIAIASHSLGRHDQLNYGVSSVAGNYAYIIVRDMGMQILDISDELNIIEVGDYRMDSIPVVLTVKDHYAYIAEWYGNLEIIDVSDPMRPTQVSVYNAQDRINEMHIINNYLFMTTGSSGLQVIDISVPTSPYLVGSFITGTFVSGVDIDCPYIYMSDMDNGLFVLRSDLISVDKCY